MESFRKTKGLTTRRPKNKQQNKLVSKQQVRQMLLSHDKKVTMKYLNSIILAGAASTTGTLVQPVLPAQGTTNGQREGDSLDIKSIQARITITNDEASIGASNVDLIRIIVVQARASTTLTISSASAPTTGVLDVGASTFIDTTSFINLNAKNELFHVLLDKSYPVNYGAANASHNFQIEMKPKVSKVNFTPGTTTPQCGGIFWIFIAYLGDANIQCEQRLVYADL
jgi:hypothetical protein